MRVSIIGAISIFILALQIYAQSYSIDYPDCTFDKLSGPEYVSAPDSFYLGRNVPSPSAHFIYEFFGIPELSLVTFSVYDSGKVVFGETSLCLVESGNYQLNWYEDLLNNKEIRSGIYFVEMKAFSTVTKELSFKKNKRVLFIK
jgi:hypothetical protein